MSTNVTLSKEQKMAQHMVDAFERELVRRVQREIPASLVTVKKVHLLEWRFWI